MRERGEIKLFLKFDRDKSCFYTTLLPVNSSSRSSLPSPQLHNFLSSHLHYNFLSSHLHYNFLSSHLHYNFLSLHFHYNIFCLPEIELVDPDRNLLIDPSEETEAEEETEGKRGPAPADGI